MPFYVGGTAGMRNLGTYAAGTTYFPNDMVQYQGSTYVATATTTGNLPTNASFWGVLAAAGATGAAGISGQGGAFYPWGGVGRYFAGPPISGYTSGNTVPMASNYLTFFPVRVPNACNVTSVSLISATANANATYHIGLYADNPAATSTGPGVRLVYGSSPLTSTGLGSAITISMSYSFSVATNIWVAFSQTSSSSQLVVHQNNICPSSYMSAGLTGWVASGSAGVWATARYSTTWGVGSWPVDMSTYPTTLANASCPVFIFGTGA